MDANSRLAAALGSLAIVAGCSESAPANESAVNDPAIQANLAADNLLLADPANGASGAQANDTIPPSAPPASPPSASEPKTKILPVPKEPETPEPEPDLHSGHDMNRSY